ENKTPGTCHKRERIRAKTWKIDFAGQVQCLGLRLKAATLFSLTEDDQPALHFATNMSKSIEKNIEALLGMQPAHGQDNRRIAWREPRMGGVGAGISVEIGFEHRIMNGADLPHRQTTEADEIFCHAFRNSDHLVR